MHLNVSWTQPQVQARAHPNVLAVSSWLNGLYHSREELPGGVDLKVPLSYADRFRFRQPGTVFDFLGPHIDGECVC